MRTTSVSAADESWATPLEEGSNIHNGMELAATFRRRNPMGI